ncbi:MAG: hypothetical protein IKA31_05020, partial [Clostridia bacterium]|nr:hypothetical protein [Clostridia bacterium]
VISEIVKGEKYPEENSQMQIYFARAGESVWDIAKSLKVHEEVLFRQNPELTDPVNDSNNKITIFKGTN